MKIDSSVVTMGSTHQETKVSVMESVVTLKSKDNNDKTMTAKDEQEAAKLTLSEQAKKMIEEQAERAKTQNTSENFDILDMNEKLKLQMESLKKMLSMLKAMREGKGNYNGNQVLDLRSVSKSNSLLVASHGNGLGDLNGLRLSPGNGVWERTTKVSSFTAESEVTTFSSVGNVRTADGRTISFNIDLEMSRSFMQSSEFIQNDTIKVMTDPLVINLDSNVASVSDQKFLFDLDADGDQEEISFLNQGSGFLALDKNADGIINDGNELFGTKSGDGFADLKEYDRDGNGWIDENDEVFERLKIWTKDSSGNDRLLSLKDANVGAIYLGNVSTQFSLNNLETNETNAAIRKTGVFLHETGEVGTIQHIDLAI